MKYNKKSIGVVALTLVLLLLPAGCAATHGVANTPAISDSAGMERDSNPPAVIKPLAQALELPDYQLADRYCSGIDLVLGDDLLLTKPRIFRPRSYFYFSAI